jgi:hypothetical protein
MPRAPSESDSGICDLCKRHYKQLIKHRPRCVKKHAIAESDEQQRTLLQEMNEIRRLFGQDGAF